MVKRLALATLVLVLALAGAAWWLHARLSTPHRGFTGDEVFVEFPMGTGVRAMADRLAADGVVPDALTFRLAARVSGWVWRGLVWGSGFGASAGSTAVFIVLLARRPRASALGRKRHPPIADRS